ncbi:hypothetical protein [Actinocorallia libanotica]|uniref:JAB domain-containing protein n=1 Tax=Actinocorallia libanotica TaxID=46162 RepID=A0ABN1Q5S2_9ACTN
MSDTYKIRIFESELETICDETHGFPDIETGGGLFGLFSHGASPVVMLATRPPDGTLRRAASMSLEPGASTLLERGLWHAFGIQSLGIWHSHHWIGLYEPSGGDLDRTRRYAEGHKRPKYTEILANFEGRRPTGRGGKQPREAPAVRLTPFHYTDATVPVRAGAEFEVIPGDSPIRAALTAFDVPPACAPMLVPGRTGLRRSYRLAASREAAFSLPAAAPEPPAAVAAPPVPDEEEPSTFFDEHILPLLSHIGEGFSVVTTDDSTAPGPVELVIQFDGGDAALFRLDAGWDGRHPVVRSAKIIMGERVKSTWRPRFTKRHDLRAALDWGMKQLRSEAR